jgi:nitronate monooxygenase
VNDERESTPPRRAALRRQLRDQLVLPAVAAPTFLCSGPDLAVAACAGGVMGTLTLNNYRSVDEFEKDLAAVRTGLDRVAEQDPGRRIGLLAANTSLDIDLAEVRRFVEVCARYGVAVVISANGDPAATAEIVHDAGLHIFHDVTSVKHAEKAIRAGVDGMVAIGAGGGGHSGAISGLAFVPILRTMFDGVIVLAGCVSTGAMIRAAEVLGADLAYLGTRFIATRESAAPDEYKALLVSERAENLAFTAAVNGVSANWMKASIGRVGLDLATMPVPARRGTDHLPAGIRPWRDIWSAGQGVSLIADIPSTAELILRLRAEYVAACHTPDMEATARLATAS